MKASSRLPPIPRASSPAVPCGSRHDGPAELIVKVKRIWTGDHSHPWAEALAARDGAIAAVGTTADVDAISRTVDPRDRAARCLCDARD